MKSCKDCIHYDMCKYRPLAIGVDICDVFRNTADVVPKSEVDEWVSKCRDFHEVAELKSKYIVELDEGLAKANAEIERLHGILLQFTDIVHKWGARNGIDTSEISLVPILQKEADGIVEKMKQEIETLKDNNEHLAVMLMEAKAEVAREIFEEIEEMLNLLKIYNPYDSILNVVGQNLAELKKKYTE